MSMMQINLKAIYHERLKLEGIGLLKHILRKKMMFVCSFMSSFLLLRPISSLTMAC